MMVNKNEIRSMLFITLSNLGDIILTTPVLERLHDEFPSAEVDVITGAPGRDIFEKHPAVRQVTVQQKHRDLGERLRQVGRIRSKRYDIVVDLKNSLIPLLAGAKYHSFFSGGSGRAPLHKRDEHLWKLSVLGIDPFLDNRFFLPVTDSERQYVDSLIDPDWKRVVVISPGAKSHLKRWDARKYARLADRIISDLMCRVLITGNEDDTETVTDVVSHATTSVKDLCGKTSIGALAELMRRSDLVISNDSAPLHIASAVNAATIAIFGPSDERRYGPLSDKSRVIKPEVPCRPCEAALCRRGAEAGCITDISVDKVLEEVKKLLY
ncbi:MAG: hypothetical protein GF409_00905 [Candidatus Omnitrophica bacterium]|nr:hypothetical protein [Candidatus Omnitrophota bacterium]